MYVLPSRRELEHTISLKASIHTDLFQSAIQAILNNFRKGIFAMAKLVFGMNQSLDGYVDHTAFMPGPKLFRHFVEQVRGLTGSIYGRHMYETMRYWDEHSADWSDDEKEFADAWCNQPKWVVSKTLTSVGPNATLVTDDLETFVRKLKSELGGEIDVAGPALAKSLTDLELIDEYRIYLHPYVVGKGKPFFAGTRPPLKLIHSELMDESVMRLTYTPR